MKTQAICILLALMLCRSGLAHEGAAEAHYLANEGVMVAHGDTRILFDPLFNESFDYYELLPEQMRAALMAGAPPWDGIDAVFISHYHDDHFAPQDMLNYLHAHREVRLYAPAQAVAALRAVTTADDAAFERVTAVALEYLDPPVRIEQPGLLIEAVRIPHAGWPERRADVENLAWRVTLDDGPTVLHLGDADTRDAHYANDAEYWQERLPHMAFPPYWYFLSKRGQQVLETRLRPTHAVGVHVPVEVPEEATQREPGLQGVDLFTVPGETRTIEHTH